jgi:hypothetical protein
MNYGGEDNGMGLTMGLGGMAGLGNYGDTLIEVNRILRSVLSGDGLLFIAMESPSRRPNKLP